MSSTNSVFILNGYLGVGVTVWPYHNTNQGISCPPWGGCSSQLEKRCWVDNQEGCWTWLELENRKKTKAIWVGIYEAKSGGKPLSPKKPTQKHHFWQS